MKLVSRTLLSVSFCAALSGSAFAQGTAATKPADATKPASGEHVKAKPAKKAKLDAPAESANAEHKGLPHATKSDVTPKTDSVVKSNGVATPAVKEAKHDAKTPAKAAKPAMKNQKASEAKSVK
jgi:hypothetical protein